LPDRNKRKHLIKQGHSYTKMAVHLRVS